MSRRLMHAAAVAALTVTAVAGGAQVAKEQASSAAAKAAINRHWDDVIATFKAGNPAALAALYTTDAMMVAPMTATVTGRVNIEEIFKDWTPTTKFIDMTQARGARGLRRHRDRKWDECADAAGKGKGADEGRTALHDRLQEGGW